MKCGLGQRRVQPLSLDGLTNQQETITGWLERYNFAVALISILHSHTSESDLA
jgi:hypothetical protein